MAESICRFGLLFVKKTLRLWSFHIEAVLCPWRFQVTLYALKVYFLSTSNLNYTSSLKDI